MNIFITSILCILFQVQSFNEFIGSSVTLNNNSTQNIEIGISKEYSIEYNDDSNFIFDIKDNNNYLINIHSINCNINIKNIDTGTIINKINLDTYSLKINNTNRIITISPLIDIIDGEEKENYAQKKCYLSINSMNENNPEIKIENKNDNIFYFNSNFSDYLNLSYEVKEVSDDNFVALFFQYNEKCNFLININYFKEDKEINLISKNISNSSYIYLKSDILKNISSEVSNIYLNIIIKKIDNNKEINMFFKIVEKEMISMIKKDGLNYGFITTNTYYQYFYFEVFQDEEGEIMLHYKRFYGELLAKIVTKDEINYNNLFNTSIYPKEQMNDTNLNYNPHSLKLIYDYKNTLTCEKGCYILVTYIQQKSDVTLPTIGYEFALLSRTWKYTDYITQIIDIPFNEYILGAFEKDSITYHYYSIYIPDDTEKIIIQLDGNYIDAFVGEGRKKINARKIRESDMNLKLVENQNVIILNRTQLKVKNKAISFAFRAKSDLYDIFAFYHFRVLYIEKDETIYYPMDSQLGNLCLPELNDETNLYHCNLLFSNKYDELTTNFSVSTPNQNEYYKINVIIIYKNGSIYDDGLRDMFYLYHNNIEENNTIDYYIFTFEFLNKELKEIIYCFNDNIENYYPQIYSSQMIYISLIDKFCHFNVKNNYTLIYKFIYGNCGECKMIVPFLNYSNYFSNRNFRGRPFSIDIDSNITNINYTYNGNGDFIFVFKLEYIMRNKGITEIKSGEERGQLMKSGNFPLYYYSKLKNESYINLNVNLRLNSYDNTVMENNFDIKGYLLDEETLKRKINGEYILLKNPIQGNYSNTFKNGLLEVNSNNLTDNNIKYLLIEIINLNASVIKSELLVEIALKENNQQVYFMQISKYTIETFDTTTDNNQYHIFVNQRIMSQVIIDISPEYNDLELIFINETNSNSFCCSDFNCIIKYRTGFKRYLINHYDNDNIYFNVTNTKRRKANYMLRYHYGSEDEEYYYHLKNEVVKKYIDTNKENITLSLTYEHIQVTYKNKTLNSSINNITFYITGILYKKENTEELINTTALLHERKILYTNQVKYIYNSYNPGTFTLIFRNIPRNDNYIYDLQIKVNAFIENNIYNEEFIIFTKEFDLTDIKEEKEKEEEENKILWYILGPILGLIVLLIIFFVIKYMRLKKVNINLRENLKSIAYENNIQKDVIQKEKRDSRKETDYDITFI